MHLQVVKSHIIFVAFFWTLSTLLTNVTFDAKEKNWNPYFVNGLQCHIQGNATAWIFHYLYSPVFSGTKLEGAYGQLAKQVPAPLEALLPK